MSAEQPVLHDFQPSKSLPDTGTIQEVPDLDSQGGSSMIVYEKHSNTVHINNLSNDSMGLVSDHKSTMDSIVMIPRKNTLNSTDEQPQHETFASSGSVVHAIPTPNSTEHVVSSSPISVSVSGTDDKQKQDFPEISPPPPQGADTGIGSINSEAALAIQDDEEALKRLQTAHKLGALDEEYDMDEKSVHGERLTASTNLQNDDYYRINTRFFYAYIRQDWHTFNVDDGLDDVRAGWVELFFDLIFVACIVHISAESTYNITIEDHRRRLATYTDSECIGGQYDFLYTAFVQFALLTSFWMEHVMYTTHFVLNQHIDELLRVFYMMFVLAMGLFVANDSAYHVGFFTSYALLRFISVCMYFRVFWIPRARSHALYHIILHSLIIVVLVVLIAVHIGGVDIHQCPLTYFVIYLSLWIVEYGSGVLQWTLSDYCCKMDAEKKKAIALPLNVPHISERYGLFVMIILGEALIAIMSVDVGQLNLYQKFVWEKDGTPPDLVRVFFFLGIFMLSYCIGRLYYNCQPTEEHILIGTKNHALRISKGRARLYIHSHMILFMALLGYGIGIKLAGKHVLTTERYWIDILLPGYSLFVIVICLNIIRVAHPFDANKKIWTFRVIVMVILFVIPLFAKQINQAVIWIAQLLCILGLVATDVEGEQKRKDEKHHDDKKRQRAKQHMEKKTFRRHLRHMVSGIGLL